MDDLISRANALNIVKDVCEAILSGCGSHYDGEDEVYDDLREVDAVLKCNKEIRTALKHLPSAQPDIVACGDCIHWICHDRRCGYWNHGVKPLDWCCHAERRTDGIR